MGPSVGAEFRERRKAQDARFRQREAGAAIPRRADHRRDRSGIDASVSFGLFAAAGTPTAIIEKVNADVEKIVSDPEFQKKYLEPFAVQPIPGPRDAFAEFLRKDSAKWEEVIKAANVKIE